METIINYHNDEISKRLYVLVNKRLNAVYGCVQAGHAVAKFVMDNGTQKWNNEYLIYLWADTSYWASKFDELGIPYTAFSEPDLNGTITAIAVQEDTGLLFQGLKLVE